MPSRRPRVLVLMLPLLLNSCVTYGLWGYEWRQDPDSDEGHYVAVQGTEWQWWRVLLRIVVTPVTVVADVTFGIGKSIVTFDWLAGDDEEEEDGISFSWGGGGSGWQSTSSSRRSGSVPSTSSSGPPAAVPRSITSGATARRP